MARDYLKGRGLTEEACRSSASGSRSAATRSRARRSRKVSAGGAACGRPPAPGAATTTSSAACSSRSPTRGQGARLPGAEALRGRPAEGEVREHARVGALPQGVGPVRPRQGARVDRARGPRVHRRGEHRRDRAAPGRYEPVVASMGTALTEAQLNELSRLTKRLWLAFDGDAAGERRRSAAWSSRRSRGSTSRWCRCRRESTRPTTRRGSRSGSLRPSRTSSTACASRSSAGGPRGDVPHVKALLDERPTRPSAGRVAPRERQARDDGAAARRLDARAAAPPSSARSTRARSSSATHSPACSRIPT